MLTMMMMIEEREEGRERGRKREGEREEGEREEKRRERKGKGGRRERKEERKKEGGRRGKGERGGGGLLKAIRGGVVGEKNDQRAKRAPVVFPPWKRLGERRRSTKSNLPVTIERFRLPKGQRVGCVK